MPRYTAPVMKQSLKPISKSAGTSFYEAIAREIRRLNPRLKTRIWDKVGITTLDVDMPDTDLTVSWTQDRSSGFWNASLSDCRLQCVGLRATDIPANTTDVDSLARAMVSLPSIEGAKWKKLSTSRTLPAVVKVNPWRETGRANDYCNATT